jgi:hypothetical protein
MCVHLIMVFEARLPHMDLEAQTLLDGRTRAGVRPQLFAWMVFGLIVLHSVFCGARIVLLIEERRLIDRLHARRGDVTVEQVRSHRNTLRAVSNLDVVPTLLVFVSVAVWLVWLRKATRTARDTGKAVTSSKILAAFWGTLMVWGLLGTAAAIVAPDPTDPAAITFDQEQIEKAAARLVVAGFLLLAVWMVRRRAVRVEAV